MTVTSRPSARSATAAAICPPSTYADFWKLVVRRRRDVGRAQLAVGDDGGRVVGDGMEHTVADAHRPDPHGQPVERAVDRRGSRVVDVHPRGEVEDRPGLLAVAIGGEVPGDEAGGTEGHHAGGDERSPDAPSTRRGGRVDGLVRRVGHGRSGGHCRQLEAERVPRVTSTWWVEPSRT